jgi:hypothetical protein
MTRKRLAAIMIPALALTFGASGSALADPVITNGGFETASGYGQLTGGTYSGVNVTGWTSTNNGNTPGYNFLYNQSNAASGGVISEGGPDIALQPNTVASPAGGNFLALDPNFDTSAVFQQNISGLITGTVYYISFYYALDEQAGFPLTTPLTAGFAVTFGSQTDNTSNLSINSGGNPTGFSGWYSATLAFTATSSSEMLSFLATEVTSGGPPFMLLDGVRFVPEPSTAVLTAIGAVGFIGVGLRRRAKAAKVAKA